MVFIYYTQCDPFKQPNIKLAKSYFCFAKQPKILPIFLLKANMSHTDINDISNLLFLKTKQKKAMLFHKSRNYKKIALLVLTNF